MCNLIIFLFVGGGFCFVFNRVTENSISYTEVVYPQGLLNSFTSVNSSDHSEQQATKSPLAIS